MSIATHYGSWSVEDVLGLDEGVNRYEVVDGALIVNPSPSVGHQRASRRLANLLEQAAQGNHDVVEAVGVRLGDNTMLIPDILVAHGPFLDAGIINVVDPAEVLMVVEIVSPESTTRDRTEKPYLYAQAGIKFFWRVELAHFKGRAAPLLNGLVAPLPAVFTHVLSDAEDVGYDRWAAFSAGTLVDLTSAAPFPISFDPAELR